MPAEQLSLLIDTLARAKDEVLAGRADGITCPCCGQYVKVWKRSIVSTAAADLCRLVSLYTDKHIHISKFTDQRSNFYMLTHWGLVGSLAQDDPKQKNGSGLWRPTSYGVAFVQRRATIRKYVLTFNNKAVGWDGPDVDIKEVLGSKFDYQELMKMNYQQAP